MKRFLLIALVLLGLSSRADAAVALAHGTLGNSCASTTVSANTTAAVTLPTAATAGNFLGVWVTNDFNGTADETYSVAGNSNTYTLYGDDGQLSGSFGQNIFYAKNINSGSTTVTATWADSGYVSLSVCEFSGVDTSAPQDATLGAFGSSSPIDTGSITASAGALVLAGGINSGNSVVTSTGSGWTSVLADSLGAGHAYKISAGASEHETWTFTGPTAWYSAISSFLAAAGGGGSASGGLLLRGVGN
jgi:hypothetical protein